MEIVSSADGLQVVPVALVRGVVTGYRVHIVVRLMVCRLFRSCWFEASLLVIVCASCDVADGLQVVPVVLVRGVVTGYRVRIV